MSELQLGLLAIGAVVVAGVFFYNKWQEARYRRGLQAGFGSRHDDVLMGLKGGTAEANRTFHAEYADPALGTLDGQPGTAEAPASGLSEILDFIVPIETPEEVPGAAAAGAAADMLGRWSKPMLWEGLDLQHNRWEPLAPDRRYSRLRAGMQLVDRRGAADESEIAAFGSAVEEAAASIGLLATAPPAAQAASKGKELDRFCGDVDIRVAVHIESDGGSFSGSRLAALAASLGFKPDNAGRRFLRLDRDGRVLCTLADYGPAPLDVGRLDSLALRAVTFELDVPRTPRGAFGQFHELALSLAQGLDARIVDDKRQPLDAAAFDAIAAQVQAVHSSMEARGIAPGGALALRLFF
jgi:hypothetical protein